MKKYKIFEKYIDTPSYSGIVFIVLNPDNDELCKFTNRINAEKFIKLCEKECEGDKKGNC